MGHTLELDTFLNLHQDQLASSGIPEHLWPTVNEKIQKQVFDAGDTFQLLQVLYENEKASHEPSWILQTTTELKQFEPKHVYLIDHAWTFRMTHAKKQLIESESLCTRLCKILGISEVSTLTKKQVAEIILKNIWKLCHTYSIRNAENIEDCLPVWYVMDEIGSAVMHSDEPNCKIVPFFHVPSQMTYSLLFTIKDINEGEYVFVDFVEGIKDKDQRAAALLPWVPKSFDYVNVNPEAQTSEYYLSGHISETIPIITEKTHLVIKDKYLVYTEYSLIKAYLTYDRFQLVDNEEEADILWYTKHFKDFADLSKTPDKLVNQFPFEYVITVKDLLSLTCRKFLTYEDSLESLTWCPITYNLKTEISNFVHYFQQQEDKGVDNFWIIKPYNLARGLDMHITNNLSYIMRLSQTGPKVAQKYISNPVLMHRPECGGFVKFDIRYVILLQSVKPLKAYVYTNFFLRFANKPFVLEDFEDYEIHFTVMNYNEEVKMKHMQCSEFQNKWKEQYPHHNWDEVEQSVFNMLTNVFECATKDEAPCGIACSPQSRAVYAADLMLEWDKNHEIQPKLLEINWTPDCQRACEYYKDFYNDIFNMLFLNENSGKFIQLQCKPSSAK